MSRTTRAELDELAAMINRRLGTDAYAIGYAYGSPRLERDGGARDVSPRLPAGQLAQWMRAFLAGIDAALLTDPQYRAENMGTSYSRDSRPIIIETPGYPYSHTSGGQPCYCEDPRGERRPGHEALPDTGAGSQVEAYRG